MSTLPMELRVWRAMWRLSQQEAAGTLGVHVNTYSRWERGVTAPEDRHLETVRWCLANRPAGETR